MPGCSIAVTCHGPVQCSCSSLACVPSCALLMSASFTSITPPTRARSTEECRILAALWRTRRLFLSSCRFFKIPHSSRNVWCFSATKLFSPVRKSSPSSPGVRASRFVRASWPKKILKGVLPEGRHGSGVFLRIQEAADTYSSHLAGQDLQNSAYTSWSHPPILSTVP